MNQRPNTVSLRRVFPQLVSTDLTTVLNQRAHEIVNHGKGEYVRGDAHTNGIESVWAVLKRSIHGTWHHVRPKHLPRYINEASLRLNDGNCEVDTIRQDAGAGAANAGGAAAVAQFDRRQRGSRQRRWRLGQASPHREKTAGSALAAQPAPRFPPPLCHRP